MRCDFIIYQELSRRRLNACFFLFGVCSGSVGKSCVRSSFQLSEKLLHVSITIFPEHKLSLAQETEPFRKVSRTPNMNHIYNIQHRKNEYQLLTHSSSIERKGSEERERTGQLWPLHFHNFIPLYSRHGN